jgi:beta-aspartyl-dipeptidase (metallo-type)
MLTLIKNAEVYAPEYLGKNDLLISHGRFSAIAPNLDFRVEGMRIIDADGKIVLPGLIDQHIHISGAGGKDGFASMTKEVTREALVACGTTTAVGLLGTDGTIRAIRALYGKVQALRQEGLSAYMFSGYYGADTVTITDSIQGDMVFVEPVLGFKIAISDIRSSYPTALELVRKLREVRTGGLLAKKKGIMHVHLGALPSKMDVLFELVRDYHFPIQYISPTHVGRTKDLFDQSLEFARMGGIIDITTGASKYTDPYRSVLYALDQGVDINQMTFSSDGHAGLSKLDDAGNQIGFRSAPIDENLGQTVALVKQGGVPIEQAFKIITTNPARNLGLPNKGSITLGGDADMCWFDDNLQLLDVFANGTQMMHNGQILNE